MTNEQQVNKFLKDHRREFAGYTKILLETVPLMDKYNIFFHELRNKEIRRKVFTACKKEIVTLLRSKGISTPTIGKFLGRDHSVIIYYSKP